MLSNKKTLLLFTYLAVQCLRLTTSMERGPVEEAVSLGRSSPSEAEEDVKAIGASRARAHLEGPVPMDIEHSPNKPLSPLKWDQISDAEIIRLTKLFFPSLGKGTAERPAVTTKAGMMLVEPKDPQRFVAAQTAIERLSAAYGVAVAELARYNHVFWERHEAAPIRHLHTDFQPDDTVYVILQGASLLKYDAIVVSGGHPGKAVARMELLLESMFPEVEASKRPKVFSGTANPYSEKFKHKHENDHLKHLISQAKLDEVKARITPSGGEPPKRTRKVGDQEVVEPEPRYADKYKEYLATLLADETKGNIAFDVLNGVNDIAHLFEEEKYHDRISVFTTAMMNFQVITKGVPNPLLGWNYSYNGTRDPKGLQLLLMSRIFQMHFSHGTAHPSSRRWIVDAQYLRNLRQTDPVAAKEQYGNDKGVEGLTDFLKLADAKPDERLDKHTIALIAVLRESLLNWVSDQAKREINLATASHTLASTLRQEGVEPRKWAMWNAADAGVGVGPAQDTGALSLVLQNLRAKHPPSSHAFSFDNVALPIPPQKIEVPSEAGSQRIQTPAVPMPLKVDAENLAVPGLAVKPAGSGPQGAHLITQHDGIHASDDLLQKFITDTLARVNGHKGEPATRFRR